MLTRSEFRAGCSRVLVGGGEPEDGKKADPMTIVRRRSPATIPVGFRSGLAFCLVVALTALFANLSPVSAQRLDRFTRSYVTPFPENDRYRAVVMGDTLGDGIWQGLYEAFESDSNIELIKRSRGSTGFTYEARNNWNARINGLLKSDRAHIAVIMVGVGDMRSISRNGKRHNFGSEEWREIYGEEVDQFIKTLKGSRVAIYWVGLPIMRSPKHNEDMQVLNEIFREKAFLNGVKFVDTWNGFADQFGRFSAYGPDLSGQVRKLRTPDGVHFTGRGYRKLAHFVEREIRGDMKLARAERNIPLAGNKAEQDRAMGRFRGRSDKKSSPDRGDKAQVPSANDAAPKTDGAAQAEADAESATGSNQERKANRAIAGVKLVRPNISESGPIAMGSSYAPMGETIALEMGNGLTALASISPFNDTNLSNVARRLPLSQRPYFRVLIKGELLLPKSGRADDFDWPGG